MEELEEAIFQFLTQNPNKWLSAQTIYNHLTKDLPHRHLNKGAFVERCELLYTRFKNVHKRIRDRICYLIFVTNEASLPREVVDEELRTQREVDEALRALDPCSVIDYQLTHPEYGGTLSLTEFLDGGDTILHLLFRRGRVDLVDKLSREFDVDFDVKNVQGQSVLDVINYGDSATATRLLQKFLDHKVDRLRLAHAKDLAVVKTTNTSLLEQNARLKTENTELRRDLTSASLYRVGAWLCVIALLASWLVR